MRVCAPLLVFFAPWGARLGWQTWRVHELPGFRQRTDPGSILFGGCMPSLNLDINYFTHPKTMRLVARLGAGAAEIPPRLWAYAAKYHVEDGELQGYEPAELLHLAGITSPDPAHLMETLVVLRWLDKVPDGWVVHDWQEHAGHLIRHHYAARSGRKIPGWLRDAVLQRDGFACVYCRDVFGPFHVDHVLPFSRGGETVLGNLATACAPCNLNKSASTPEEWAVRRG